MPVGIVSAVYGARCEVLEGGHPVTCLLRGRLKLAAHGLAVGDHVEFRRLDASTAVVERILERRNELTRSSRERLRRRKREAPAASQVVLANPDQVVFVAAARNPGIQFPLMDRALALARAAALPAAVCINKMDLAPPDEIRRLLRPYERLGLPVHLVSAETGDGLNLLRSLLKDRLSFFWGGSGVGKSSLIQALTRQEVQIGRWRTDNPRGPHTTNVTRLYPLPGGGLIADTPGFDWLELDTVQSAPDRTALFLPEAAAFAQTCRFPGCSHCGEPGCGVMAAVLRGEVDRARYARFRVEIAELAPPPVLPLEMFLAENELIFRMREGNTSVWTTLQLYYLFLDHRPEKAGLLEALGVAPDAGEPHWALFHELWPGAVMSRARLTLKVTGRLPLEEALREGDELILRERGIVKGVARVSAARPARDAWRLRKAVKGTPLYEHHAFWSDLKAPPGAHLPPVEASLVTVGHIERFDLIPELALGAITRTEAGPVLDYLEIGSSEDERARE